MEAIKQCLLFPGNRVYMFREQLQSFKETTLVTLEKMLPEEIIEQWNKSDSWCRLKNGSIILWRGFAENRKELKEKKGSMECGSFFIDEAYEVGRDDFLFLQSRLRWVLPNGTRPVYKGCLASNPANCWLRHDFIEPATRKPNYEFIQALPTDNPDLPDGYIEGLREAYPEEMAKRLLEGDWNAFATCNSIIPFDLVKKAIKAKISIEGTVGIGCDVAVSEGEGADENVIYVGHGGYVIDQRIYKGKNTQITGANILGLYKQHKAVKAVIDDLGVGHGVSDFCVEMGMNVLRFVSGARPSNRSFYKNLKTEAYWNARKMFDAGRVCIPDDPILIQQLSSVEYEAMGRFLMVDGNDETKKKYNWSPDRADALVLMLWGNRHNTSSVARYVRDLEDREAQGFPEHRPIDNYGWNNYQVDSLEGFNNRFQQWGN